MTTTGSGRQPAADHPTASGGSAEYADPSNQSPPMAINRSAPIRFAPPRSAKPVHHGQVQNGDWAQLSGYWWRVKNLRDTEYAGIRRCDLESPRGEQMSIWVPHLQRPCRG